MHTEHHRWHSPALDGKPMDLLVFGHAGAKLFVFPTSMGTYREWPDRRTPLRPRGGRPMALLVFGHAGAKLFVFPTSMGTYREWPDRRMHLVLRDHLENGGLETDCLHHGHARGWGR